VIVVDVESCQCIDVYDITWDRTIKIIGWKVDLCDIATRTDNTISTTE